MEKEIFFTSTSRITLLPDPLSCFGEGPSLQVIEVVSSSVAPCE